MKLFTRSIFALLIIFISHIISSDGYSAYKPKMRPYTGIGVLIFPRTSPSENLDLEIQLYEEPGLYRISRLKNSRLSGNQWIFGIQGEEPPLIVSARKGDWLEVFYDDAGRKAWLKPHHKMRFISWEHFLKSQTCHILPGLKPHFYQLQKTPNGALLSTLTSKQIFKLLKLENEWGMVLTEKGELGWLKWRDTDSRLTLGTAVQ